MLNVQSAPPTGAQRYGRTDFRRTQPIKVVVVGAGGVL
jgi:hypothetical protein